MMWVASAGFLGLLGNLSLERSGRERPVHSSGMWEKHIPQNLPECKRWSQTASFVKQKG